MQVEWLQPYTDAKIKELGASGVKQLLAVPISFVSEHIETLEEIDMEYRELAIESGIKVSSCGMLMSMQALQWLRFTAGYNMLLNVQGEAAEAPKAQAHHGGIWLS